MHFFAETNILKTVENIHFATRNSFPSGHTTAAMAMCSTFALLSTKPWHKTFFLILGLAVGYSRIYLSQHFFVDVYVGSMIGVGTAFVCYLLLQRWNVKLSKKLF